MSFVAVLLTVGLVAFIGVMVRGALWGPAS